MLGYSQFSSSRFIAHSFKLLERGHDFFSNVFSAGRRCEAAMSQLTEGANNVFDLSQSPSVLLLYLCDLGLEGLACFFDIGVDRL